MEVLFIAVHLSHASEVRNILSKNPDLVHVQDGNGDQPLHLAAKMNELGIGRILVEFDASIGKRNYDALTPMGVARMNGYSEFVSMLKIHYTVNKEVREGRNESETKDFRRINFESIKSQQLLREDQTKKGLVEELERWKHLKKYEAAISIQRMTRKRLIITAASRLRLTNLCATRIQRTWRWNHRYKLFRLRQRAAKKIQTYERMRVVRNNFVHFEYERLWLYRATRLLAYHVQRFWRGHTDRRTSRRERNMLFLPDPGDALNFEWWLSCQKASNPPARTWGIYCEYTLYGTPCSWYERNSIKRKGAYYRDVKFYAHNINRRVSWDQPDAWLSKDKHDYQQRLAIRRLGFTLEQDKAARNLQDSWRAKLARRHLRLILRAERILANSQSIYELDSTNMTALCNYTFFVHAGLDDLDKASTLYDECIRRMLSRGGDHPFVLYSYAIHAARSGKSYLEYVTRANECMRGRGRDIALKIGNGSAKEILSKTEREEVPLYSLANAYLRKVAISKQTVAAWHNYALCRALVYSDIDGASIAFRRALAKDPNNALLLRNFNDFLQRVVEPGCAEVTNYDVFQYRESRIKEHNDGIV